MIDIISISAVAGLFSAIIGFLSKYFVKFVHERSHSTNKVNFELKNTEDNTIKTIEIDRNLDVKEIQKLLNQLLDDGDRYRISIKDKDTYKVKIKTDPNM